MGLDGEKNVLLTLFQRNKNYGLYFILSVRKKHFLGMANEISKDVRKNVLNHDLKLNLFKIIYFKSF